MKRRLYLITLLIVIILSAGWNAIDADVDKDAENLINKASYHYGLLEEYPGALKYLEQAFETTQNPRIQALAMVKTAYVYYLMKKGINKFKPYITSALALNPGLKLDSVGYKKPFLRIFTSLKNNSGSDTIERHQLESDQEWQDESYKRFFLQAGISYIMHADSRYKDIYNSGQTMPRFTFGFRLGRVVYFWTGFGLFSAKGTIPMFDFPTSSSQSFFSLGAGFMGNFSNKLSYKLGFGLFRGKFKEEALDVEVKGNATGFDIDGGVMLDFGNNLYLEASLGYLSAGESTSGLNAKLGGLRSGLSLGIKF